MPFTQFFLFFGYKVTKKFLYLHHNSVLKKLKLENKIENSPNNGCKI